ncbi:nucleoside permease [Cecembia calidifontis]|uniref:Nucleoside transporter n=1 Tax=Cecembia calidifontis TaxID=1187080 RepID=A0A4Q7PF40_9BACT|nr:nucleoside permease [Cecembia calidifontis]RZS98767.1 nucleoside transporter [Cecembia calidifontis]
MSLTLRVKLSFMMFLEFFIWGSWYVTMGTFLGMNLQASGTQIGNAFSTQSFGAIIAPFIIGLIADKYFNAEKILGALHILGAVALFMAYQSTSFQEFYPFIFLYMVLYMPTLALVNSVSFRQMKDPEKEFSPIRVWGTIGWITSGLTISYIFFWDSVDNMNAGMLKYTFLMASIASIILGLFSFTLPKTPPKATRGQKVKLSNILGLDAIGLLKDKNYAVFFLSSILICIPLAFYYQNANPFLAEIGVSDPTGKMTIGQVSEALFLLLLPVFFKRFGFKKTLMVGMMAWVVRYALFSIGDAGSGIYLLLIGIALHGICYDFFFVSGQIYTDSKAGEKFQSSAQGLITLATYGVGMLIGFAIAGQVTDLYKLQDGTHDWNTIWMIPSGIAILVVLIFAVAFKNESVSKETQNKPIEK